MLRKTTVFILLLFSCHLAMGQAASLDSLLSIEASSTNRDCARVELLSTISHLYYTVDLDKMKSYADSAIRLSEAINYPKGIVDARQKIALYYRINGKFDTAISLNNQALQVAHETDYKLGIAKCNFTIGNIYKQQHVYEKAIEYYEKSLTCFNEIGHIGGAAAVASNLGIIYKRRSEYVEALKSYQKALQLYEQAEQISNQAMVCFNIGGLYKSLGDWPLSLEYLLKSLSLAQKSGNKADEARAYNRLGLLYLDQQEYAEALKYFRQSLKVAEAANYRQSVAMTLINIGRVELLQNHLPEAVEHLQKSIVLCKAIADDDLLASSYQYLGRVSDLQGKDASALNYYQLAIELQKQLMTRENLAQSYIGLGNFHSSRGHLRLARKNFQKGLEVAKKDRHLLNIRDAAKGLSDMNTQTRNFEFALDYYKLYQQMADSLNNEEKSKKMTRQLMAFNQEKELARIAREQKEKDRLHDMENAHERSIKNYYLLAFIFSVLLLGVILLALRRKRMAHADLQRYNAEISAKNQELEIKSNELIKLDVFKKSMIAMLVHDLKHPISHILNFPKKDHLKFTEVVEASGLRMLNLVENLLDVQKFEEVGIEPDYVNFNLLAMLKKARKEVDFLLKEKAIDLHFDVPANTWCYADEVLMHRVVINLLTNAIKFSPLNATIYIKCDTLPGSERISLAICDEGEGIPDSKKELVFDPYKQAAARRSGTIRATGLGLSYCKMAVEAHGGFIRVEDNPEGGTIIRFSLKQARSSAELQCHGMDEEAIEKSNLLTVAEKTLLEESAEKLSAYAIYKSSVIREIINQIPDVSEPITQWKEQVTDAVFNGNEERYKELLKPIIEPVGNEAKSK